jgi:hypothetical protein
MCLISSLLTRKNFLNQMDAEEDTDEQAHNSHSPGITMAEYNAQRSNGTASG